MEFVGKLRDVETASELPTALNNSHSSINSESSRHITMST